MNKPGNYLHLWARNTRISFFGQNLPFFSIFHTKFKIEKYFTFWHNFCSTPVLINICVGGFMQNFRTLGLIIKKVRDLFNLSDKYGKIIQCVGRQRLLKYLAKNGIHRCRAGNGPPLNYRGFLIKWLPKEEVNCQLTYNLIYLITCL